MATARGIGLRYRLLTAALLLVFGTGVHAASIPLTATLTGAQETPPNASPGIGSAAFILDDTNGILISAVTFQGLTSPTTSADIEARSGLIIPSFPTVPIGVTQGSFTDIWPSLTARDIAALEFGSYFVSIGTSAVPGGEIRGQILVPEPGALVLGVTGAVVLLGGVWLRRRRPLA